MDNLPSLIAEQNEFHDRIRLALERTVALLKVVRPGIPVRTPILGGSYLMYCKGNNVWGLFIETPGHENLTPVTNGSAAQRLACAIAIPTLMAAMEQTLNQNILGQQQALSAVEQVNLKLEQLTSPPVQPESAPGHAQAAPGNPTPKVCDHVMCYPDRCSHPDGNK